MNTEAVTTGTVYWTTELIAKYTGQSPASVGKWCHRHGVKRSPNPDDRRERLARAADVIAAAKKMRGQGWRRGEYGRHNEN